MYTLEIRKDDLESSLKIRKKVIARQYFPAHRRCFKRPFFLDTKNNIKKNCFFFFIYDKARQVINKAGKWVSFRMVGEKGGLCFNGPNTLEFKKSRIEFSTLSYIYKDLFFLTYFKNRRIQLSIINATIRTTRKEPCFEFSILNYNFKNWFYNLKYRFNLKDLNKLQLWIDTVKRKGFNLNNSSRVCSDHFFCSDFVAKPGGS
ncbi:THAP domain-containing protein 1-like [Aphis craccivora]|uniref:THAP domain-containing protein 1-like n=1 Tax=Aphis craccivora TaxID=307492 RepID=A0A6G0YER4_APHCR|nr:THAP domain-containing protein 1-like [Aphis craccivora]